LTGKDVMALVLTNPSITSSTVQAIANNITIPVTQNLFVDTAKGVSIKWIITISNADSSIVSATEIMAIKKGTEAIYSIYGQVGDNIQFGLDISIINDEIVLNVINLDTFDFVVTIVHIGL
jgi:hypothetical protein